MQNDKKKRERKIKIRDVGSISNLGGMALRGHIFLKEKGAFFKIEKGTSLFIAKSWGHVPPVPPGSYVYDLNVHCVEL